MTEDDAEMLHEPPSTVDSFAPLLTASEINTLREKLPERPKHLLSPLEEEKLSAKKYDFSRETVEVVLAVHSDIFQKAIVDDSANDDA